VLAAMCGGGGRDMALALAEQACRGARRPALPVRGAGMGSGPIGKAGAARGNARGPRRRPRRAGPIVYPRSSTTTHSLRMQVEENYAPLVLRQPSGGSSCCSHRARHRRHERAGGGAAGIYRPGAGSWPSRVVATTLAAYGFSSAIEIQTAGAVISRSRSTAVPVFRRRRAARSSDGCLARAVTWQHGDDVLTRSAC